MSSRALGTIQTLSDMVLGCIGAKRHRFRGNIHILKYNKQCTATPPLRVFLCSFWKSWDLSSPSAIRWARKPRDFHHSRYQFFSYHFSDTSKQDFVKRPKTSFSLNVLLWAGKKSCWNSLPGHEVVSGLVGPSPQKMPARV